jgi:3'(2'), 5'-bisphosphate nucleotidase
MNERRDELGIAMDAVRAASRVCRTVQHNLVTVGTIEKKDRSPVTVADFASQAIVCQRLQRSLPGDPVVGEETAGELRRDEMAALLASVVEHVASELGVEATAERVLEWINRGACEATGGRYWTLDPIDGTKGFLRGEQYAVALGLIENGEVVLGVLGCPNLPGPGDAPGALFTAVRGGAALVLPLWDESGGSGQAIRVAQVSCAAGARFCESVESEHSNQAGSAQVARLLGITAEPYRLDSQCKYATVARGDTSIYLRMPTRKEYREKIWDHAAGKLLVEAAGGTVTDVDGKPLDFHHGRTLERNRGIVATCGTIHEEVLEAIQRSSA